MESERILSISLNHSKTQLMIGSTQGFKILQIHPLCLVSENKGSGFSIVESYEDSQLLALVGAGQHPAYSPRRLLIWNIPESTAICETSLPDTVLSVCLNKIRIVVVLADSLHIYDTTTMKRHKVIDPIENPKGLGCLSPSHGNCYLLYTGSAAYGQLTVYDCFNFDMVLEFPAHNSPLAALEINSSGLMFATASEKGTVIRVWGLPEGTKLYTFKRGILNALTYHLAFSINSQLLISCSDSGSVHVYNLSYDFVENTTWTNYIKDTVIAAVNSVVPTGLKDSLESNRSFIIARTNFVDKFVADIVPNTDLMIALSFDGRFAVFRVDYENGGDAVLQQEGFIGDIMRV